MVKTKMIGKTWRSSLEKRFSRDMLVPPTTGGVRPCGFRRWSRKRRAAYTIKLALARRLYNNLGDNRGALVDHTEAGEMDIAEFTSMLMADATKDIEKKDEYITRLHRQLRAERANARKDRAALMKLAHHYRRNMESVEQDVDSLSQEVDQLQAQRTTLRRTLRRTLGKYKRMLHRRSP